MSNQAGKELVVELRVPLPAGLFEEAGIIGKVQYAVAALKENIDREIGVEAHTLTVSTVNKRGPKGNGAAAQPRQRRAQPPAETTAAAA